MTSPHTRLKLSVDGFTIILKNTHFQSLEGIVVYAVVLEDLPVLAVKFPEAARDFLIVLEQGELGMNGVWLHRATLHVTLELADMVITDQISRKALVIGPQDTQRLQEAFRQQQHFSKESLREKMERIEENLYRYL